MKIAGIVAAIALAVVVAFGAFGTGAWFSDTASVSDTIRAGTLDLSVGATGAYTVDLSNVKPGDTFSYTITVRNVGSLAGNFLLGDIVLSEPSEGYNPTNKTANEFAEKLIVTSLTFNDTPVDWGPFDMPSPMTLFALQGIVSDLSDDQGIVLNPSSQIDIGLQMQLDEETGNDFQADGVTVTYNFRLKQIKTPTAYGQ